MFSAIAVVVNVATVAGYKCVRTEEVQNRCDGRQEGICALLLQVFTAAAGLN